jgi:DNA-binding response OmpR family regulator
MQRLLDAGAAAYLTKPLDVEELLSIIDTVCGANDLPAVVD